MVKAKQKVRVYLGKIAQSSISPGANLGFAENLTNLYQVIEALLNSGELAHIKYFRWTIRAKSISNHFALQSLIVQTAGTFADTVNLADREIADLLDAAIDDDFGYKQIGNFTASKLASSNYTGATSALHNIVEKTIVIPQDILNLLNKEIRTERLQEIILGLVGLSTSNTAITIDHFYEIGFIVKDKGITIR